MKFPLSKKNQGILRANLCRAHLEHGILTNSLADYQNSINAGNKALKISLWLSKENQGNVHANLCRGYLEHGILTNSLPDYQNSINAANKALDLPISKTVQGRVQRGLGRGYLERGILTKNFADYQNSIKAFNATLKLPYSEIDRDLLFGDVTRALANRPQDNLGRSLPDQNLEEIEKFTKDIQKGGIPRTEPADARTGPNTLTKLDDDHNEWERILKKHTKSRSLSLSPDRVDIFKKVFFDHPRLDSGLLDNVISLRIAGNEGQPYDLRDIADLGERFGKFKNLKFVDLRNTKIDELNVAALSPSLRINLRDSVMPLPLQKRLEDHFREGEGKILLTPRPEQIQNYAGTTLENWIQEGATIPGSNRDLAGDITLEYLRSGPPHPSSLDVSRNKVDAFDHDWHAMVASPTLNDLIMSGNQLKELDLAKVALSPNLKNIDASNNLISHVHNAQSLARLDSLETLDLNNNQLARIPDGIEYAPESSTVDFRGNELSSFAKIDAKLIKFSKVRGPEMLDAYLREQRGPTVVTDPILAISTEMQVGSHEFTFEILDDLAKKHESIQHVERELNDVGADASSRARWSEVGELFERHAYAEALECVITNPGGPFKVGRNQRYHNATERAATIAGNRASTLHQLPGQSGATAAARPGKRDYRIAAQLTGAGAKGIPVPVAADVVGGVSQGVVVGIDLEASHYFDKFHSNLLKMFRPSELQMLGRVVPFAMTMTMGEQLESGTVREGKPRRPEPSDKVIAAFKWVFGMKNDPSDQIELRGLRDAAYLMDDIASGAVYGIPNDEKALLKKLERMTFQQKVEEPLAYWANGHNCAEETLPFKKRYVLCDSPLDQQLAAIAKNYTLNDLEQRKEIRELKGQLESEKGKRHEEKRSRRATTQSLINLGVALDPPSPWMSETEDDKAWWAKKFPSGSRPALLSSEEAALGSRGAGKKRAIDTGASTPPRGDNTLSVISQARGEERGTASTSRRNNRGQTGPPGLERKTSTGWTR